VETEDQFQKVTTLGCEYVQGYYFAKPAPAQATEALMEERCDLQRAFAMLEQADRSFDNYLEPCSLPTTDSSTEMDQSTALDAITR
jgi:hypothetical protein